ncbi:MAG: hypothetical protein ER33_12180 [Cyanobium sp. CACIAM 14]|nr:MAG: hypothetical protein ER33_12180 [Cyanobium sp. CACIAM 14]
MNPFWVIDSARSFEAACAAVKAAVPRHGFGVLGLHDLGDTLRGKGFDSPEHCRVHEVCNPRQAATVLRRAMALTMTLPCRISVYTQNGRTRLGMIRPVPMMAALVPVAQEVEATLQAILQEAAG